MKKMKLINKVINLLYNLKNKQKFLKRLTKLSVVQRSIEVRKPEYININGDIYLGENCKLLCWDLFENEKNNQKLSPKLQIGKNLHATRNLVIQCAGDISIGDNVLIASNVFIVDFNHGINPMTDSYLDNPLDVSRVKIENGVWIGNSVIILPGVTIGRKSIIGAGSVVTKSIPEYSIAVGNPAKVIKQYDIKKQEWRFIRTDESE